MLTNWSNAGKFIKSNYFWMFKRTKVKLSVTWVSRSERDFGIFVYFHVDSKRLVAC